MELVLLFLLRVALRVTGTRFPLLVVIPLAIGLSPPGTVIAIRKPPLPSLERGGWIDRTVLVERTMYRVK